MMVTHTDARARAASLAAAEGFDFVRFAPATPLPGAREAARAALSAGRLDGMNWITPAWVDRSTDPGQFLAGARTVIVLALAYHRSVPPPPGGAVDIAAPARGRVARYAQGRDYHRVFEKKLRRIARALRDEFGAAARATVDYGPLLERPLAAAAGMGWPGKSTMLLVPGAGPWVLLGEIVTDLELPPDPPLRKTCGACARCIAACPTGALAPGGHLLDARLCISYHTIENRGPIPADLRAKFSGWVFGCDECLDSCPVGARAARTCPEIEPRSVDDAFPPLAELVGLDEAAFVERFRGRPIMRAKRDGLLRNACVALGNVGTHADLPALIGAMDDDSALVRGHAAWGVGRLVARLAIDVDPAIAALESRLAVEDDDFVREELRGALDGIRGGITPKGEPDGERR